MLLGVWLTCLIGLQGCQAEDSFPVLDNTPYKLSIPAGLPKMPIPDNNDLTQARVEFGKLLFYDPLLSRDSSLSCASCHVQHEAFADKNPISVGIEGRTGLRNVPSIINVGYHPYFFAEGGSPSLEQQLIGPIEDPNEMGFNARELVLRLMGRRKYEDWAWKAYGRSLDMFVISHSLASFERTLIAANSPYDQALNGDSTVMSPSQWRGYELFFSDRVGCGGCHPAPLFTNFKLENIGQYKTYEDKGRYRVSLKEEDIGKFKIPSLRNVALTAPYFHDGSHTSLDEVIEHFNLGGLGHPNQSPAIRPLGLSRSEKEDLKAFLVALTDSSILSEAKWAPNR